MKESINRIDFRTILIKSLVDKINIKYPELEIQLRKKTEKKDADVMEAQANISKQLP